MAKSNRYVDSERYRQMLVKDGERRFHEWHSSFLKYQKEFLQDTSGIKYVRTRDENAPAPADNSEPKDPFGIFS